MIAIVPRNVLNSPFSGPLSLISGTPPPSSTRSTELYRAREDAQHDRRRRTPLRQRLLGIWLAVKVWCLYAIGEKKIPHAETLA